ncbi:MAG: hypothetical protein JWQ90_3898 [Hydrocarboniphaga sp.]|nr:hypothetical protein [Hydrocarboniphaga sp.]
MSFLNNRPQGRCYRGDKYSDAAGYWVEPQEPPPLPLYLRQ